MSLFSFQGTVEGQTFKIKQRQIRKIFPERFCRNFVLAADLGCWASCVPRKPGLHRKEVIQPLVLERLPCYDFTPVAYPTFGSALLAVRLLTSGVTNSHGVTGGVYKARERIHRGMLIRDY